MKIILQAIVDSWKGVSPEERAAVRWAARLYFWSIALVFALGLYVGTLLG